MDIIPETLTEKWIFAGVVSVVAVGQRFYCKYDSVDATVRAAHPLHTANKLRVLS